MRIEDRERNGRRTPFIVTLAATIVGLQDAAENQRRATTMM